MTGSFKQRLDQKDYRPPMGQILPPKCPCPDLHAGKAELQGVSAVIGHKDGPTYAAAVMGIHETQVGYEGGRPSIGSVVKWINSDSRWFAGRGSGG